jgi:hypothetical protein
MHFQALAITCMALHYHSQVGTNSFHELMIVSAAFGGYIVILVGILTGIFTGQPVNKRIVRTFIVYINHQPDATIFQFIILTFIYGSTCFGRFPAHH